MNRKIIITSVLGVFLLLSLNITYGQNRDLQRISFYPKNSDDYYFKPICDMEILDDVIYGVENREHKVIAFKIEFPQIKYDFDVGKPGQGPGDLQYPLSLSIWENELAIIEQGFISFFKKNNEFSGRFRIFSPQTGFIFCDNKIYWVNPNLKENYLIEVYTKKGKRISSFGTKFLEIDPNYFQGKDPSFVQYQIYKGNLFFHGNSLYYFNSVFGKFFQFSLDGEIIKEGDISGCFEKRGRKIKEFNSDQYIKKKNQKGKFSGYSMNVIFEDGYLCKEKIYFASTAFSFENGEQTIIDIRTININTMNLLEKSIIRRKGLCRLDSMAVLERSGEDYILLSL
ncbi:MAG: hypothetical protein MIO92_01040, partial [Methanosarcinaceae archaeon]|nr:hypothetical protein [Methanosarcinaceae archaeon]